MSDIVRRPHSIEGRPASFYEMRITRQAHAAVLREQAATAVRVQATLGDSTVAAAKLHELDHLTREAMSGQAMLRQWGAILAAGDPFAADDLKFFTDTAKLGKGEIIADVVSSLCRESRGQR